MNEFARRIGVLLLMLLATNAHAQEDCDARRAALKAAQSQLRDCLSSGKSCDAEFNARKSAEDAIAGCPEPTPTPAATAPGNSAASAPAATGKLAILVEPNAAPVEAAAREALAGADLLDSGPVRAARMFQGGAGTDDDAMTKLRASLGVARLVVVDVKADGATRFVGVRAVDSSGTTRSFAESTEAELAATVKRLVSALPAVAASPVVVAPTPPPTPRPATVVSRSSSDDDEANEQRYAKKGTFTLAVSGEAASRTATLDSDLGEFTFDERVIALAPTLAYFLADGVFVSAGFSTDLYGYSDETDATEYDGINGFTGGAGYLASLGPVFVGPKLVSRFRLRGHREEDSAGEVFNYEQSSLDTIVGLTLRVPVGTRRGGAIGVNVYFRNHSSTYAYDIDGNLRATEVGISQGLSIYW